MQENPPFYTHIVGDNMKAHIREEKKIAPLNLGKGTLLQNKDGEIHKVCDTMGTSFDESFTDDIVKIALSKEKLLSEKELWFIYGDNNVYVD